MSVEATLDVGVEVLGGLVTNVAPSDLPHGVSPDCQDIQFQIGSAKTRPGVTLQYTLAGNPAVNSLATYETLTEIPRFVILDSLGVLRRDVIPGGALTPIFSGILPNSFFKSCSLFGRQYFAFGAGTAAGNPVPFNGVDLPRQYDDANFDRISQVGPGLAPTPTDESFVANISAAANSVFQDPSIAINSISEVGNLVTVITPGIHPGTQVGDAFTIAGCAIGGYNVTGTVAKVIDGFTFQFVNATSGLGQTNTGNVTFPYAQFILTAAIPALSLFATKQKVLVAGAGVAGYNGTWPVVDYNAGTATVTLNINQTGLGNSNNGTITPLGNIVAGLHQISVIFVTRSGYYTKPAPPSSWTSAGGNKRCAVRNIPTGPPNVIARVLCFTAAAQASFYHLGPTGLTIPSSNMYIADNVTTQITVDFTDAVLQLGTLDDPLFQQIVLPPVAGVLDYSSRLLAWGEQANLQAFLNLSFDGGFSPSGFPLGWTPDLNNSGGGTPALSSGYTAIFGDAYAIVGNNVAAIRGKIAQGAAVNYLGNAILQPNTAYTVRARIKKNVNFGNAGTVHINLQSTAQAFTTVGLAVADAQSTQGYSLVTASLTDVPLAAIPSDLFLQLYVDGTPTGGVGFVIDEIEIYPTAAQFNNSNLRASKGQLAIQGQESFDSQKGLIQWNLNDGTSVRSCFKIRERLFIVKEHSFGVTQDDGVNEPSLWSVLDVSKKVGTPSVNGVAIGEDWAVIAHRTGLYLYWGGEVLKISEEIQPTWDTINWNYGYTISVAVDTRRRRIFVCAPFGAAIQPNKTLVLDYHDVGSDASAIAANPPIHLTYTGSKRAFDRARKWTPWTIAANSVAQIELSSGQTQIYFGSNDLTGNVNQLDDTGTVFTDNGAQIPSYYTTSFLPDRETKQGLQLTAHRELFSYLTSFIQGSGTVGLTAYLDSLSNAIAINPQGLTNPATKDLEVGINQTIERMAVKFSNSGAGQWFDLQNMTLNVKPDPWATVRGSN